MKISKTKLQQIIREELTALKEFHDEKGHMTTQGPGMPPPREPPDEPPERGEPEEEPEPTLADYLLEILIKYFPRTAEYEQLSTTRGGEMIPPLSDDEDPTAEEPLSPEERQALFDELFSLHNMMV